MGRLVLHSPAAATRLRDDGGSLLFAANPVSCLERSACKDRKPSLIQAYQRRPPKSLRRIETHGSSNTLLMSQLTVRKTGGLTLLGFLRPLIFAAGLISLNSQASAPDLIRASKRSALPMPSMW